MQPILAKCEECAMVQINDREIPQTSHFRHFRSIIHKGRIEEDITYRSKQNRYVITKYT